MRGILVIVAIFVFAGLCIGGYIFYLNSGGLKPNRYFELRYSGKLEYIEQGLEKGEPFVYTRRAADLAGNIEKIPVKAIENPKEGSFQWWVQNVLSKQAGVLPKSAFQMELAFEEDKWIAIATVWYSERERGPKAATGRFVSPKIYPFLDALMDGPFIYRDEEGNVSREETWSMGKRVETPSAPK